MDAIQEYLTEELQKLKNEKRKSEEQIHKIDIETEVTNQTVSSIQMNQDTTSMVFMSDGKIHGFDTAEIKKLNQKKEKLEKRKVNLLETVMESSEKIKKLENLLKEVQDRENIKGNEQKVYNTYEVIYMQEADRQRIARDIHDAIVQGLTALTYKNEFVGKIIETDKQRARLELEKINNMIRDSIDELRNIIFDLRPMSLDDLGFEKTFYTVIEKIKSSTDMVVKAEYMCDTDKIDSIVAITAIRVIQELCSNSIKYSKGTKIEINVTKEKDKLIIRYSDNGQGYDLDKPVYCRKNNTGFGLNMMKERIALLHGMMNVCYNDGRLIYEIQIPADIN